MPPPPIAPHPLMTYTHEPPSARQERSTFGVGPSAQQMSGWLQTAAERFLAGGSREKFDYLRTPLLEGLDKKIHAAEKALAITAREHPLPEHLHAPATSFSGVSEYPAGLRKYLNRIFGADISALLRPTSSNMRRKLSALPEGSTTPIGGFYDWRARTPGYHPFAPAGTRFLNAARRWFSSSFRKPGGVITDPFLGPLLHEYGHAADIQPSLVGKVSVPFTPSFAAEQAANQRVREVLRKLGPKSPMSVTDYERMVAPQEERYALQYLQHAGRGYFITPSLFPDYMRKMRDTMSSAMDRYYKQLSRKAELEKQVQSLRMQLPKS